MRLRPKKKISRYVMNKTANFYNSCPNSGETGSLVVAAQNHGCENGLLLYRITKLMIKVVIFKFNDKILQF